MDKYFHTEDNRKWVFTETVEENGSRKTFTLRKAADIPITRHLKIKMDANLFDAKRYEYFEKSSLQDCGLLSRNV